MHQDSRVSIFVTDSHMKKVFGISTSEMTGGEGQITKFARLGECTLFQVLGFIRDLYNADHVRYTTVNEMSEDILKLARSTLEMTNSKIGTVEC